MSNIPQVEIVRVPEDSPRDSWIRISASLSSFAFRSLIIWWAVASIAPQYGITYWQILLPVYAIRLLILPIPAGKVILKRGK